MAREQLKNVILVNAVQTKSKIKLEANLQMLKGLVNSEKLPQEYWSLAGLFHTRIWQHRNFSEVWLILIELLR